MLRLESQAPSPTLTVSVERRSGVVVVDVEGNLDLDGVPRLCAAIEESQGPYGPERVIVVLSRVGFCDSSGIRALVGAAREVRARGGRLDVVAPEDAPVQRMIAATGAAEFLGVRASLEPPSS